MKLTIKQASWHRNGIGGVGFYAILFEDAEYPGVTFIASLFDAEGYCAVYAVPELSKENVAFACGNSWRGDRFESALRPLLQDWPGDVGRVGPFSVTPAILGPLTPELP